MRPTTQLYQPTVHILAGPRIGEASPNPRPSPASSLRNSPRTTSRHCSTSSHQAARRYGVTASTTPCRSSRSATWRRSWTVRNSPSPPATPAIPKATERCSASHQPHRPARHGRIRRLGRRRLAAPRRGQPADPRHPRVARPQRHTRRHRHRRTGQPRGPPELSKVIPRAITRHEDGVIVVSIPLAEWAAGAVHGPWHDKRGIHRHPCRLVDSSTPEPELNAWVS
jgi:hypothetical protein